MGKPIGNIGWKPYNNEYHNHKARAKRIISLKQTCEKRKIKEENI